MASRLEWDMPANRDAVLMIGLDAADIGFLREHRADLPTIARFLEGGAVATFPSGEMPGAVWPSFISRATPGSTGMHHHLQWDPAAMRLRRVGPDWIAAPSVFWRDLARAGRKVVAFDVPFLWPEDAGGALEIANWASHDLVGRFWASEPGVERHIRRTHGAAPMGYEIPVTKTVERLAADRDRIVASARAKGKAAAELIRTREWDLFLVVFGETHRAGHLLYPSDVPGEEVPEGGLLDVYRAVDAAVGEVIGSAGEGCDVVLFALHGMGPNTSQSHLARGMLTAALTGMPSGGEAVAKGSVVRWLRRAVPDPVQHAIAAAVPVWVRDEVVSREIGGGVQPGVTQAISLDGDLPGYWRLLVQGREAAGAVGEGEQAALRERLAEAFAGFTDGEGRPLVHEVRFPSVEILGPRAHLLPDLLAVWTPDLPPLDEARHPALGTVRGRRATGRSGNHRMTGFLAHLGPRAGQGPGHFSGIHDLGALPEAMLS